MCRYYSMINLSLDVCLNQTAKKLKDKKNVTKSMEV